MELSALVLRRLAGMVTLTPKKPEVGREYYHAQCKIKSWALLDNPENPEESSNSLQWWRRRESNPRPKNFHPTVYMVRSAF